jgi:hypothetical protein
MAIRLFLDGERWFIVNKDRYSNTTSRHQYHLSNALKFIPSNRILVKDTHGLKKMISLNINDLKTLMAETIGNSR